VSGHCRDLVGSAIWVTPATREEVGCFDSLRGLKKALRLGSIMKLACSAGWARRGAAHRRGRSATQAHSVQDRFGTQQGDTSGGCRLELDEFTRHKPVTPTTPCTRTRSAQLRLRRLATQGACARCIRPRRYGTPQYFLQLTVCIPCCAKSHSSSHVLRARPAMARGSAEKRAIRQTTLWVVLAPTLPQSSNLTLNTRSYAGGRIHSCENDDDLPLSECVIIV